MLQRLRDLWPWHEIRGCPGRFIVSKIGDEIPPEELIKRIMFETHGPIDNNEQSLVRMKRFERQDQDDVFVAVFLDETGGGLITFCKKNGSFVHTLNEPSGLMRKLEGLGFASMLAKD